MFSIDLEDARDGVTGGMKYQEAVPRNTTRYLEWLEKTGSKCTFFVTGTVAERYPFLVRDIFVSGHEIACHTARHVPLDGYTPDEFRADLNRNLSLLAGAGVTDIKGFRAPSYSMTSHTSWAYRILEEAGIEYSSSVLPGKNPLGGWPGFGNSPCLVNGRVLEIPLTTVNAGIFYLPVGGGIYFRVLPFIVSKYFIMNRIKKGEAVIAYFHPYDIDTQQERFMHGGIANSRFYNKLMYMNRNLVITRLEEIINGGGKITTYARLAAELRERNGLRICKTY